MRKSSIYESANGHHDQGIEFSLFLYGSRNYIERLGMLIVALLRKRSFPQQFAGYNSDTLPCGPLDMAVS